MSNGACSTFLRLLPPTQKSKYTKEGSPEWTSVLAVSSAAELPGWPWNVGAQSDWASWPRRLEWRPQGLDETLADSLSCSRPDFSSFWNRCWLWRFSLKIKRKLCLDASEAPEDLGVCGEGGEWINSVYWPLPVGGEVQGRTIPEKWSQSWQGPTHPTLTLEYLADQRSRDFWHVSVLHVGKVIYREIVRRSTNWKLSFFSF